MTRYRSVEALANFIGSVEAVEQAFQIPGVRPARAPVTGDITLSDGLPDREALRRRETVRRLSVQD